LTAWEIFVEYRQGQHQKKSDYAMFHPICKPHTIELAPNPVPHIPNNFFSSGTYRLDIYIVFSSDNLTQIVPVKLKSKLLTFLSL